jgi:DNA-binding transcriptional LysR family regulator
MTLPNTPPPSSAHPPRGHRPLARLSGRGRHLNFRAAADELALTQSAVSRQIQALEEEVGVPLFLRHTRAVELTSAGAQLQRAVAPAIERMDAAVRLVRQTAGRRSVAITTWASFASMWLIPRMEEFQRDNPGIDIRIDASDVPGGPGHLGRGPGPALQPARPGHAGRHAPVWRAAGRGGQPLAAQKASPSCAPRPMWPSSP